MGEARPSGDLESSDHFHTLGVSSVFRLLDRPVFRDANLHPILRHSASGQSRTSRFRTALSYFFTSRSPEPHSHIPNTPRLGARFLELPASRANPTPKISIAWHFVLSTSRLTGASDRSWRARKKSRGDLPAPALRRDIPTSGRWPTCPLSLLLCTFHRGTPCQQP